MRLNRGTLVLLVAALAVIVAVLVLNSNPATAPGANGATATPSAGGPLFSGVDSAQVAAYSVRDNNTGAFTQVVKAGDAWSIAATNALDLGADPELASGNADNILELSAADSFETDALADFGLDTPDYTITLTLQDGTLYTLYIGGQNPQGNRYYATLETGTGEVPVIEAEVTAEATAEATAEPEAEAMIEAEETAEVTAEAETTEAAPEPVTLSGTRTVHTLPKSAVDALLGLLEMPPYLPTPTPTPTPTRTPNPYSEVEQTATAQALFDQLNATATAQAQAEQTPEATEALISTPPAEVTAEATEAP